MLKVIQHRLKNVKTTEKYCTLCVDEMALKSHLFYDRKTDKIVGLLDLADNRRNELIPVNNAITLMVTSIDGDWKIPVSYYLVGTLVPAKEIKRIIVDTFSKLETIGIY